MVKPFFSIIIPTLNEEKYLPQLLGDLVKQTFQNFEVIVVDGMSKDQTLKEALKFQKKLLKLIVVNSKKRNLPYQRNLGAKKANGKYLVFFDADVSVPDNYLEKIHEALKRESVDFLTTWLLGDEKSFQSEMMMTATNLFIEACKIIDKPFACGGNAIVSKIAFGKIGGYREDLKMHEDFDLSVRLNQNGYKLYVLKKPRLTISLRRMRSQGKGQVLGKYALYTAHFFLKGAPTKDLFNYEMGGQVYKDK